MGLTLFVLGAALVTGAIEQAARGARMLQWQARAADLAISKLAELQALPYSPTNESLTDYLDDDLEGWAYEVIVDKLEMTSSLVPPIDRVTVVIRKGDYTYRLSQLVLEVLADEEEDDEDAGTLPTNTGGAGQGGGNPGGGRNPGGGNRNPGGG